MEDMLWLIWLGSISPSRVKYIPDSSGQILVWRLHRDWLSDELSHAGHRYALGVF